MPKVSVVTADRTTTIDSAAIRLGGEIVSRAFFQGPSRSIHVVQHTLGAKAAASIAAACASLAVFVWKGTVRADDVDLTEKACVVIEPGAALDITAGDDGAVILVFNEGQGEAAPAAAPRVHILAGGQAPRSDRLGGHESVGGAIFANARDPVKDVWLHETSWTKGGVETDLHSHSEDEVIFVIDGSIQLGSRICGPGTALAIAAGVIYGFRTGPDGLAFINFRAASPTFLPANGSSPQDEAKLWERMLGRPQYCSTVGAGV